MTYDSVFNSLIIELLIYIKLLIMNKSSGDFCVVPALNGHPVLSGHLLNPQRWPSVQCIEQNSGEKKKEKKKVH